MQTYFIITESRENLPQIVAGYFEGATILPGVGLWQGKREESSTILLVTDDAPAVQQLADQIMHTNAQDSILVLQLPAVAQFFRNGAIAKVA